MRDLKFRAWDKIENKMKQPRNGDFIGWHAPSNWKDCYEIMQFTGLLDKNGKEIYEGDIVRHRDIKNAEVIWDDWNYNYGWHFYTDNHYLWETDGFSNPWDDVIVIGNIYESPDLIK